LAEPPPRGLTPDAPFPAIVDRELDNGLRLKLVRHGSYPIVELRLLVLSGKATDGAGVGTAALAAQMLKAGGAGKWDSRQLLERAESMGSSLQIDTDMDSTEISLSVLKTDLEPALEVLAAVAMKPRFSVVEFSKLRQREIERASSLARTSGRWTATMVLYGELYELPMSVHGYAHYDVTPKQLSKLTLADCRRWHAKQMVPQNAVLVAAGDVDPALVERAAQRYFGPWKGELGEPPNFTRPTPPEKLSVFLVDRPGSAQSEIFVATLGPERHSEQWVPLRAADQVLGGGVAGRLFLDVRERRSLAYSTGSQLVELAHAPVPILLSAGTQTPKTAHAVKALLEHFEKMGAFPPGPEEVEIAARYLSDSFLLRLESTGTIADLTAHLAVLGLSNNYYDEYRKAVRSVDAAAVFEAAKPYFRAGHVLVVVTGDAKSIAKPLTFFGPVQVIDPENEFARMKLLPYDPKAELDVPAAASKP
jgi:predicted Zn-dependent peptidase